jgi:hypothetical protein
MPKSGKSNSAGKKQESFESTLWQTADKLRKPCGIIFRFDKNERGQRALHCNQAQKKGAAKAAPFFIMR